MTILETEHLELCEFELQNAPFLLELFNEPAWLKFIGDKNVNSIEDAENYITEKLIVSYRKHGFGFYVVYQKSTKEPTGICGLIDRPGMNNIEIGFAFLAKYRNNGFGYESSVAMLKYAREQLKIDKIVAITHPDNVASGKLLEKLGLQYEKLIQLPDNDKDWCKLYS